VRPCRIGREKEKPAVATFDYLKPGEAVRRASPHARDWENIVGLKAADAGLFLKDRTRAGYLREPSDPWRAHAYVERFFREIQSVQWAKDADPGVAEVFFTDGESTLLHKWDLLCVERPIDGIN
jgi:hypothetical protein